MTVVFLVNGSSSPYNKPGDWNDAGHQIELVGCGGRAGAASPAPLAVAVVAAAAVPIPSWTIHPVRCRARRRSMSASIRPSAANGTAEATKWGSASNSVVTNSYYVQAGLAGTGTAQGIRGQATTVLNGTPPTPVYTKTVGRDGGNGGQASSTVSSAVARVVVVPVVRRPPVAVVAPAAVRQVTAAVAVVRVTTEATASHRALRPEAMAALA